MAVAVLAAAIGVNLLVFTVVNALWVRPLPFAQPDRVVTIPQSSFSRLDHERLKIFDAGLAGQVLTSDVFGALRADVHPEGLETPGEVLAVTPDYFTVLGVRVQGRGFLASDDVEGAAPVAIVSYDYWRRALQSRTDVIGQQIQASPESFRVVGIAPKGFDGARRGERADLWIPTEFLRRLSAKAGTPPMPMMIFARLGPGQTAEGMQERFRRSMSPRDRDWFLANDPSGMPSVVPLTEVYGTSESRTLLIREGTGALIVSSLAALVLLGGCATIAALILMHYERRRAEFALKIALGAQRSKLVGGLARELAWIGSAGAVVGLVIAASATRALPTLQIAGGIDLQRLDLAIDWRVAGIAMLVAACTLFAAAALPIIRSTRARLAGDLIGGFSSTSLASHRLRQMLLCIQVGATMIVLVSAGLFVRVVANGFGVGPGFDVDHTLFVSIQERALTEGITADTRAVISERTGRLLPLLQSLPGVRAVAEGIPPIGSAASNGRVNPRTLRVGEHEEQLLVGQLSGGENLLETLGVPILAGRGLGVGDDVGSPRPAVITRSLAERLWFGQQPLGQVLSISNARSGPFVVVGVAGDVAFGSLMRRGDGVVVTAGVGNSTVVGNFVLSSADPKALARVVKERVPGAVVRTTTGRDAIAQDIGRQRLGAWFFSGFGLVALLLGVGGAFGLVAYLAESQRREFGVRLALGANASLLVRQALSASMRPVAVGAVLGLMASMLLARLYASLLVGIGSLDLLSYAVAGFAMISSTGVASLVAAWRLRRLSPSEAFRSA
jgi:predicted permease